MEWVSAPSAGRRPAKFLKRLLPAESHLLRRPEDSSRVGRNLAARNRLARNRAAPSLAARSRGNPDRRPAKAEKNVRSRGRNLMVRVNHEANHGRMHEAEIANPMPPNPPDLNRVAPSPGLRSPATANFRHARALPGKLVIARSRGSVIVVKRAKSRQGKNRTANLLDLSRLVLRARDSSRRGHDLLKRDLPKANRDLRERSPGPRKARVRELAAQNRTKRDPLASRSPRLGARSPGRSVLLPRMAKDLRPNAASGKKGLEPGRARRAAPSHSGRKIRGAVKVRRQQAAAIVRTASMRRERAAKRNDRSLPRNGGIGTATAASGDCH